MTISFKGAHFPQENILMGVRWYVAYPLSYRHVGSCIATVRAIQIGSKRGMISP
jgi:transposase-like protein